MGNVHLPANEKLGTDRAIGNFGGNPFSTVRERLAKDIAPQDEEETKAAVDEILAI